MAFPFLYNISKFNLQLLSDQYVNLRENGKWDELKRCMVNNYAGLTKILSVLCCFVGSHDILCMCLL